MYERNTAISASDLTENVIVPPTWRGNSFLTTFYLVNMDLTLKRCLSETDTRMVENLIVISF